MKTHVQFQHFQFVYDFELPRNGRQMGALCNIQIDRTIKIVDISLDQGKKRDSPKIKPKACTLTKWKPRCIE